MTCGDQRVLAVVIGRAGSKGLPSKNLLPLAGRPLICHTIDDALAAACVDRVVVSTDGEQIARCAREMGVEVIMRPAELADDAATVDSAVRHAVEVSRDDAEIVVILYANVPLRPHDLIDRAVARLIETGADSVQSYCAVGKHHPYWMMRVDEDGGGRVAPYVENTVYRRQDLPPLYVPDGGVIAVRREALCTVVEGRPHAFLGRDRRGILTQPGEVVDVDTGVDLELARAMIELNRTTNRTTEARRHGEEVKSVNEFDSSARFAP